MKRKIRKIINSLLCHCLSHSLSRSILIHCKANYTNPTKPANEKRARTNVQGDKDGRIVTKDSKPNHTHKHLEAHQTYVDFCGFVCFVCVSVGLHFFPCLSRSMSFGKRRSRRVWPSATAWFELLFLMSENIKYLT